MDGLRPPERRHASTSAARGDHRRDHADRDPHRPHRGARAPSPSQLDALRGAHRRTAALGRRLDARGAGRSRHGRQCRCLDAAPRLRARLEHPRGSEHGARHSAAHLARRSARPARRIRTFARPRHSCAREFHLQPRGAARRDAGTALGHRALDRDRDVPRVGDLSTTTSAARRVARVPDVRERVRARTRLLDRCRDSDRVVERRLRRLWWHAEPGAGRHAAHLRRAARPARRARALHATPHDGRTRARRARGARALAESSSSASRSARRNWPRRTAYCSGCGRWGSRSHSS